MLIYDSHCHLDYIATLSIHDTPKLIPAVTLTDNLILAQLKQKFPQYKIGFGIHPWYINPHLDIVDLVSKLEQDIENSKPDCIGEIGLDYTKPHLELQLALLQKQLELAKFYNLPVIFHCVKAYNDLLRIIKQYKINCGIIHGFNNNITIARQFTELGFFLGIGGLIYKKSKIQSCLSRINLNTIILESDAPFMPINGKNISKSDDAFLYAQIAAKLYNMNLIDLINYSNNNFLRLFRN